MMMDYYIKGALVVSEAISLLVLSFFIVWIVVMAVFSQYKKSPSENVRFKDPQPDESLSRCQHLHDHIDESILD